MCALAVHLLQRAVDGAHESGQRERRQRRQQQLVAQRWRRRHLRDTAARAVCEWREQSGRERRAAEAAEQFGRFGFNFRRRRFAIRRLHARLEDCICFTRRHNDR